MTGVRSMGRIAPRPDPFQHLYDLGVVDSDKPVNVAGGRAVLSDREKLNDTLSKKGKLGRLGASVIAYPLPPGALFCNYSPSSLCF